MSSSGADAPAKTVENRTFDEIAVGDSASLSRTLSQRDIELFAVVSGDVNPAQLDPAYGATDLFHRIIAHGMWGGVLVSAVLGTLLPGPGTIYLGQDFRFQRPVGIGDTVTAKVTAREKRSDQGVILFDCVCTNQKGETVITGTAEVKAPTEKIRRRRAELPEVRLNEHLRYHQLIARCADLKPVVTAVVHPCDSASLSGAAEAASIGLILPVLVGPEAKIRAAAESAGIDIGNFRLVAAPH